MLYISYIKLDNFIQLKGASYERYYDPFKIYMYMGANGSGKSSVVAEHSPKPTVHGSTTIIKNKEGMKTVIYKDTEDKTLGYKVVHFYVPKEEKNKEDDENSPPKHSVKSFLYRLYNDEIAETIVNGSTNEFREKMRSVFDVDYDSIKITGIGMKYGGTLFEIRSCGDSDRYNYIKSVLSNLEEIKNMENHITVSLQLSNRRIKELKSILGDISNVDFTTEMEKMKLDINDYSALSENITRDRIRLDNEFEKLNMVSPTKRNEIVEEYKIVKEVYDVVRDIPDFLSSFKALKEKISLLGYSCKNVEEELATYIAEKRSLSKDSDILDRQRILETINSEIAEISKANLKEYNLEELDEAIDIMNSIHSDINIISSNTDTNISEYAKYNSEEHIHHELADIRTKLNELMAEQSEVSSTMISDHEKSIFKLEIPKNKSCDTCPLHQLKDEIDAKMDAIEKNNKRLYIITSEIENIKDQYNKLANMSKMYTYYRSLVNKYDSNNPFIKEHASKSIYDKIHNWDVISNNLRGMKNSTMQLYKLRDLTNKKKEIESSENVLVRIGELDEKINQLSLKKRDLEIDQTFCFADPLNRLKEEHVYKYASNIKETIETLYKTLQDMSELNSKNESLQNELSILDNKYGELKNMIARKTEELTKMMVEKERYDQTSSDFKLELEDSRKLTILKVALTKKIPTILLNSYMIYVKNEANDMLSDIDRYSVMLPKISYENGRNEFDIPVRDYDEVKSCAVLSKGESSLISLAIILPLIYMSTKYRILLLDEIDSALDAYMKTKIMGKIIDIPPDRIVQIHMVSHGVYANDSDRIEIIKIGG